MTETAGERIAVVIADDQYVARRALGVAMLAYDDLMLAGQAASGEEAIELCARLHPQVVVMDLKMPGMGGLAAIRAICEQWPGTRVVALSNFPELTVARAAKEAGASACLAKHVTAEELVAAIRDAVRGSKPALS